jgi:protein gp37
MMAEKTGIQWTQHTFNPVWGCTKVSEGCRNCYAETLAARFGVGWGPAAPRRTFGPAHWREPLRWDRKAARAGDPARVFCGSMCDVGEEHPTTEAEVRRLWPLVEATPNLHWLLLSKRPGVLAERIRESRLSAGARSRVCAMTSVEGQPWVDERLAALAALTGRVGALGVSCEPLLGPVDLRPWLGRLDWVIVGGESSQGGAAGRPFDVAWAASVREQCAAAGVAYFLKQLGSNPCQEVGHVRGRQAGGPSGRDGTARTPLRLADRHGGDPAEWPAGLDHRELPRLRPVTV